MSNYLQHLIIITILFLSQIAYAQMTEQGKGAIQGVVKDAKLDEPFPYVSVFAKPIDLDIVMGGQITDEEGRFDIQALPTGKYEVHFQFIGYQTVIQEVLLEKQGLIVDLGSVPMYDDVATLNEVEVIAERSTIEQKVDRKVINIGKDLATVGPTAADLMINLPSINVDQDGGISMRGNDNVIVLVDGKPTNQNASQLLEQLPSGAIKSIELITNPSAKYVPEGMSGIINIVLHKNTNNGFNGLANAGLTVGEEVRHNAAMDLNYRTGKVNLYLNYATSGGPRPFWGTIDRLEEQSHEMSHEIWDNISDRRSHLIKSGLDYDITNNTTLSFYSIVNDFNDQAFRSTDIIFQNAEELDFGQDYSTVVDNFTSTYNIDLKHQMSNNSSIELEVDYSEFSGDETAQFLFYGSAFDVNDAVEQIGNSRENTTINLDYENDLGNQNKLEIGLEARIQNMENAYDTSNPNFKSATYDLNRDIYAAYLSYSQNLGKWSYQVGARLEEFEQRSQFDEEGSEEVSFDDLIRSIYPSAFLTYTPDPESQKNTFNLSLSRRVDRPNINQLSPVRAWSSARITNIGNPSLFPQFTNSVEFNYTRQLTSGSVSSGVFYRRIFDEITRFGFNDEVNPGNILFSYENYQSNSAYGLELSGNYQLSTNWSFNASFDLYSQMQRGVAQDVYREVHNVLYNIRMNQSFKVNKNLTLQLIGLYRGGNTNLQYRTLSFYFVNLGARYSLFEGRGTLSLNLNDIFHTQRLAFSGDRPVVQDGNYNWDSQTFFIGYAHKFGNDKKQSLSRKKRDKNEKKNLIGF
ncbi:MAG: TonB-dependent receptor [Cyclobacteriaceae bacterium]